MREIKFRAWNKKSKVMFIVNGGGERFDFYNNNPNFSELMQFTGLKDKNNKDIFEGDILRFYVDEGFDDGEYLGEVVFVDGRFSIKISDQRKNPKVNDLYKYDIRQIPDVCEFEKCEVIGNSYENPDLLTFPKEKEINTN